MKECYLFKCNIWQAEFYADSKGSPQKQDMDFRQVKRYREQGIEGLKNRTKSSRRPDIPEEIAYKIKSQLSSNKQG